MLAIFTNIVISGALSTGQQNYSKSLLDTWAVKLAAKINMVFFPLPTKSLKELVVITG